MLVTTAKVVLSQVIVQQDICATLEVTTPTPDGSNTTIGEECPVGYYCPAGTPVRQKCQPGLVIPYKGARSEAECQTCPAGKICSPGSSIPEDCTVGYYCPYNDTRRPCPLQTFNNVSGATDISFCHPCPAGYYCWYEGMVMDLFLLLFSLEELVIYYTMFMQMEPEKISAFWNILTLSFQKVYTFPSKWIDLC